MLTHTDSTHTQTANSHRPRVLSVAFLSLPISFQKSWMRMERQCGQKTDTFTKRSLHEGDAWFHIPFRWFHLLCLCSITSSRKTFPDAASSYYSRYLGKQFFLSACKGSTFHHHGEKKSLDLFPGWFQNFSLPNSDSPHLVALLDSFKTDRGYITQVEPQHS